MYNVQQQKPNGPKRKYFAISRIKKVFGTGNYIEALLPVRIMGLCVGVMPFNFFVEPGHSRAVPNIPSAIVAIASILSYAYFSIKLMFFDHGYNATYMRIDALRQAIGLTDNFVGFATVFFTTFSAIASRHAGAKTMELFAELDEIFAELYEKNDFSNTAINIICNMGVYFVIQIAQLIFFIGVLLNAELIKSLHPICIVTYTPIFISCTTLIIFMSYVCVLTDNAKGLNRLLLNMLTRPNLGNSTPHSFPKAHPKRALGNEDFSKRLNILIRIHDRICDCAENINRAYGFRNLVVISCGFARLISSLFDALLSGLFWTGEGIETYVLIIYLTLFIGFSFVLSNAVNACEESYNQVIAFLLKIFYSVDCLHIFTLNIFH